MIEEVLQTIAPNDGSTLTVRIDEPLLTEDAAIDDLELLAIANYLKTYKSIFKPIRRK